MIPVASAEKSKFRVRAILLAALLVYLVIEVFSFAALKGIEAFDHVVYEPRLSKLNPVQRAEISSFLETGHGQMITMDPELGWVTSIEANSARMRDDREYSPIPASGTLRIAAFGDSYTYGMDVALHESWAKLIPQKDASIEVLNYGVIGYGLDQAYLRYLKAGTEYHPDVVFIGYLSENFERDVNVFRPFYCTPCVQDIFTKPRFALRDNRLVLIPNPLSTPADYRSFLENDKTVLRRIGQNDYHYEVSFDPGPFDISPTVRLGKLFLTKLQERVTRPTRWLNGTYNTNSEAYRVTERIFDDFYAAVQRSGAQPVIVMFGELHDLIRSRKGESKRYQALLDHFRARGYLVIDTVDAFKPFESRYKYEELIGTDAHYTALGNRIVADYILRRVNDLGLRRLAVRKH